MSLINWAQSGYAQMSLIKFWDSLKTLLEVLLRLIEILERLIRLARKDKLFSGPCYLPLNLRDW